MADSSNFKTRLRAMLFSAGVPKDLVDAAADVFIARFRHSFGDEYAAINDNGDWLLDNFNEKLSPEAYLTELKAGNIGSDAERKYFSAQLMNNALRVASGNGINYEHRAQSAPGYTDMNNLIRQKAGIHDAPEPPPKSEAQKRADAVNDALRRAAGFIDE
jgi:hypothetical protein